MIKFKMAIEKIALKNCPTKLFINLIDIFKFENYFIKFKTIIMIRDFLFFAYCDTFKKILKSETFIYV